MNIDRTRPRIFLQLLACLWLLPLPAGGQVNVSIHITPPYSTKISDYTMQPNKILATLVNVTPDFQALQVYLGGSIQGEGGIRISTRPGSRPADPITLQPGVPYILNPSNLSAIFSPDQLVYEGITQREIIYGNGLPEDVYTICLRVYDYTSQQPLSEEAPSGCSNPFEVRSLEPPLILLPYCQDTVQALHPQNVLITWTRPAGAPLNVQYRLRIVEIHPPGHDPNDALNSASAPLFLETNVMGNAFVMGPAQPAMVQGKTYAFTVTAFDPMNRIAFRNRGTSEVCSFTYGHMPTPTLPFVQVSGGAEKPGEEWQLIPSTTISGKLMAKFPTNPFDPVDPNAMIQHFQQGQALTIPSGGISGGASSGGTSTWGGLSYNTLSAVGMQVAGHVSMNQVGFVHATPAFMDNGAPEELNNYGLPLITQMKTRKFLFAETENLQYTRPLANVTIKLVARVAFMSVPGSFGIIPPQYGETSPILKALDLNGAFRPIEFLNVVLDVTETDDQGNYQFSFQAPFFTGPVIGTDIQQAPIYDNQVVILEDYLQYVVFPGVDMTGMLGNVQAIGNQMAGPSTQQQQVMMGDIKSTDRYGYLCLKIEIENQKFCSPDIDIFAMPGDAIQLPNQVAKLKTYNLTVEVKSDQTPNQLNTPNKPLAGADIRVYRDAGKLGQELPLILDYEGQRLETLTNSAKGQFKNVSIGKTDALGRLYFPNLVRHAQIQPQYLIDISTRNFETASTDYDYTLYNYEDIFRGLETTADNQANMSPPGRVVYNHQYPQPTEVFFSYQMKPLPPEIKGRVMAKSNLENIGMSGVFTQLLNQSGNHKFSSYASFVNACYGNKEKSLQTNESGFFRFTNLPVHVNQSNGQVSGPYRRVFLEVPGYNSVIIPPIHEYPYKLLMGQLKDVKDINLEPEHMLSGYVEDEDGNPVTSYIKSSYSPYYKTEKKYISINPVNPLLSQYREVFDIPSKHDATSLTIKPLSSQYFARDTSLLIPGGDVKIVVYKKLHRPVIKVRNAQGQAMAGVKVEIGGQSSVTDAQGIVRFRFASAAEQFILKLIPGSGYAPRQEVIHNVVTPGWVVYEYVLQAARTMQGTITIKNSQQVLEGALVFAELVQTGGVSLYLEARSNAQGFYKLEGIPRQLTTLQVHVVKEGGNPSYIGLTQTVTLTGSGANPVTQQNFSLTKVDDWDLSAIWGFPVAITSFQAMPGQPAQAELSGYLLELPAITGFSLQQPGLKVPFQKIIVSKGNGNKPMPNAANITLESNEIPIGIGSAYTGSLLQLTKSNWSFFSYLPVKGKLSLQQAVGGNGARISGHVKLDLGSFKMAHDFSGELYAADEAVQGKTLVFSSIANQISPLRRFILGINNQAEPVPVKNYRVYGFQADAVMDSSFLTGNTIRLKTILHTQIPGCKTCPDLDLQVRAGELVIQGTEMYFQSIPGSQLSFNLENWKVFSEKPWWFDINEEAIVLPEALIVTGQGVDARVKNMKIRPTSLGEGSIDMSGAGLTLGGIANVKLSGTLQPVFNYDASIGHYRISVVGEGQQVAGWVDNLPNTSPSRLNFASIGMLSNSQDVLTVNQHFRFYNILDMYVDQIMSGPGFFKLNGQPDLGIPGYDPPSAVIAYTREGNKLVCKPEPLQGAVTCKGHVEFILDLERQKVETGKFTAFGDVKIKPAPGETGPAVSLRGLLTKTNQACGFQIIKVDGNKRFDGPDMQVMMAGKNPFRIKSGGASVAGNQWGILQYEGLTGEIEGLKDKQNQPNTLTFKVNGGIDVSADQFSVTNIQTPLGGINMTYDFAQGILVGNLSMQHIPLGFAYLYQGMATVRFDNQGYYLALNLQNFAIGPNPGMPGFRGGFIAGATSKVAANDIAAIQQNFRKNLPDFTATGLTGFYVIGEKCIINQGLDLVFTEVSAAAGLGIYINTNFNQNPEFTVGGYGYCDLDYTQCWEIPKTGPSCCAGVSGKLAFDVSGGYKNNAFYMNNCGSLSIKPFITGSCGTVLDHLGFDHYLDIIFNNIGLKTEFGVKGSDFYMNITPFDSCL